MKPIWEEGSAACADEASAMASADLTSDGTTVRPIIRVTRAPKATRTAVWMP